VGRQEGAATAPADPPAVEIEPDIPPKTYTIKPVFFDFDKYSLKVEYKTLLDELVLVLKAIPLIEIEAIGHTDSKGPDGYNMMLAKKRSSSVVQYLVSKGIDAKRLRSSSKGETTPVALNQNPDGSDSPAGRKLNRRVEFNVTRPDLPNVMIEEVQVPSKLKK